MPRRYFTVVIILFLISVFAPEVLGQSADSVGEKGKVKSIRDKKIAITFDNLPADRNYNGEQRKQINRDILAALEKHKAPAAGFVIGDNIEGDWEILVDWLEKGHTIGFMAYSGQDINNVPLEMFFDDLAKGKDVIEDILQSYKQKSRFFRFAYLHYGDGPEIRKEIDKFLNDWNIKVAHATVVTEDFVYNLSLEKIINAVDSTKLIRLRNEYFAHVLERLGYAETLSLEVMGRPIRQILQLRANRLNAMFLDGLLGVIAEKGYRFISLENALKDKVYRRPDAYYESRGVSFLERIKYSDPDLLPAYED